MKTINSIMVVLALSSIAGVSNGADGWSLKFNLDETEATRVTVQSGAKKDDNSVWTTWKKANGPAEIRLPEDQQPLNKIYMKLVNPEQKQVEACLLYDGHPKRRFGFDGENEDHDVEVSDDNKGGCHI